MRKNNDMALTMLDASINEINSAIEFLESDQNEKALKKAAAILEKVYSKMKDEKKKQAAEKIENERKAEKEKNKKSKIVNIITTEKTDFYDYDLQALNESFGINEGLEKYKGNDSQW